MPSATVPPRPTDRDHSGGLGYGRCAVDEVGALGGVAVRVRTRLGAAGSRSSGASERAAAELMTPRASLRSYEAHEEAASTLGGGPLVSAAP